MLSTTSTMPPATPGAASAAARQLLRFSLADGIYGAPIDAVREILEVPPTTELPRMPAFVRGVMNLRGAVVPVVDLAARFGLPPTQVGRRSCVVVVDAMPPGTAERDRQVLGLLVDAVHEVLDVSEEQIGPPPSLGTRINPEFIAGVTRAHDHLLTVLDLPRALNGDDLAQLVAGEPAA
ncbi:MAG: chemotaxis protein CheW [Burkholderiaceae bacterium]